jgi:hypothetical protein
MIMVGVAVPAGQSGRNGHALARCAVGERLIAVTGPAMRPIRCLVAAGRVRTTAGTPAVPHPRADPGHFREPYADSTRPSRSFRYGHH